MKKHVFLVLFLLSQLIAHAQILDPIKWKIQFKDKAGSEKEIIFTAKMDDGWHIYNTDLPDGGPVSTSFNYEKIQGATLIGKTIAKSKEIRKIVPEYKNMELSWFVNEAIFVQKIRVTDKAKFLISGHVQFMGCNDERCIPPTSEKFRFSGKDLSLDANSPASEKKKMNR